MKKILKLGFLKENFIKLIPLSEEKIIYCFKEIILGGSIIKCGLAQIKNNETKVNSPIIISVPIDEKTNKNYIKRNAFDIVKISNKEVILSYYMYEKKQKGFYSLNYYDLLYYIKLKMNDNNKFENETRLYNITSLSSIESNFYSLNLLKNNDDNFVSITIFNGGAEFVEYGYASCINSHDSIFIGEKIKISFSIKSLFKINDDIFL